LKPAWANSSMRPYVKGNPSQKRTGGVAQSVGPEFKPQYHKKKKVTEPIVFCSPSSSRLRQVAGSSSRSVHLVSCTCHSSGDHLLVFSDAKD
jgi:hypothetical protein